MIYQHTEKYNPGIASNNLISLIPHTIATTTELSLNVQEQGVGDVTLGQSQAKMLFNWDAVQESGEAGND